MPVIILGGSYGGVMTPTEAAGVAAIYAIPVGFLVYRGLTWRVFWDTLKDSSVTIGVVIVMIVIGTLMDDFSGLVLSASMLTPIAVSTGIDPIQFAAIVGVNMGMGNITPPTAPLLFLESRVTGVSVQAMMKPTLILIAFAWLPTLMIITCIPQIAMFLPNLFYGG